MTCIYTLSCPITGLVRYVGKTQDFRRRFLAHMQCQKRHHTSHWIASLKRQGLAPVMEVLEECLDDAWKDAEEFWIIYFRFLGCRLTNITRGGRHSGDHRKGKPHRPETLERMRRSQEIRISKMGMTFNELQSQRGKRRWLKSQPTLTQLEPWKAEGISRSGWFKRRKEEIAVANIKKAPELEDS